MSYDAVRLELVKNAIGSVVDEMVLTVVRIAYSSIMKDTMDLSSAFCDRNGRMIAQGLSLPLHLGSIPDAMQAVIGKYGNDIAPGDVVVLNDPYEAGGMHLPDIFMFVPVFVDDYLLGYAVLVGHYNDVGGRVPGSSAADSTEIYQEGLRIPVLKLYERGRANETLLELIRINVRIPDVLTSCSAISGRMRGPRRDRFPGDRRDHRCVSEAVPERIRAPGEGGTTSYSVSGYDAEGTFNMYREAVMGNWGGGAHRDGLDGVANPAANIGNAPCEVVERQAPLRIERYELVPDSGGAGQWRGGLAVMRQLRYLGERATLQLRSDRRHHRPFGVHGGLPGAASTNLLLDDGREEQWPTKFVRPLLRNQAIRHVTAGAGGYGDPLLRDPARVLDDVRNGKVSVQAAERDYGVRVSGPPWCVEEPATRELRAARASSPDTAPGPRR